jgi:hypothetical protein
LLNYHDKVRNIPDYGILTLGETDYRDVLLNKMSMTINSAIKGIDRTMKIALALAMRDLNSLISFAIVSAYPIRDHRPSSYRT